MKIDVNKKIHQDNLKAEIYLQFKIKFLGKSASIICEYKTGNCRLDMLAYDTTTLDVFGIIEVRRVACKKEPNLFGKQHLKYSDFGCPLFYISEFNMIGDLLDKLETNYDVLR